MSKIYDRIQIKATFDLEDAILFEAQFNVTVRSRLSRLQFEQTSAGHSLNTSLVDRLKDDVYFQMMVENSRKQIINEVYGEYVDELQEALAMLYRNAHRDDIGDILRKVIDSMRSSE
ncbi:hypothetical protein UFOVP245_24 [uncultured Caudovirales phage]|uniref:Uncharacterized protein n=1 Tax=uncultured Caudovirales phage TaxID=2100421 RepID=A0A6J7WVA3_9CAUD|nr:hypothetical protein UFOVP245_24 [uncultured Caudovirales phage]